MSADRRNIFFISNHLRSSTLVVLNSINVTVFTQGAQVCRSSTVNLAAGITDLVFSGLFQYVNPTSVQAGVKGNFIVLDVKHIVKYPEHQKTTEEGALPKEVQKEIKLLED